MESNPQSPFPADYRSARHAFIAACESRGVDVVSRVNPNAKGPDGAALFLDAAAIGERNAKKALLLLSGIYGVDGAFGSGVQTGLMHRGIAPPPAARLVMVHAVNPFGFAWSRQGNEDSHNDPGGLLSGGHNPSWSAKALAAICTEDLAKARTVIAIALQTGAGAPGRPRMIVGGDAAHFARARAIWSDAISTGAHQTGTPGEGLARMLPRVTLTFAALEAGTSAMGTPEWKKQTWNHAHRHVTAALAALA